MSEPLLRAENLEKEFGLVHAVRSISFEIEEGQVVGFIGANSAGKTTTMRIMATLDLPTSGKIAICGYDIVIIRKKSGRVWAGCLIITASIPT